MKQETGGKRANVVNQSSWIGYRRQPCKMESFWPFNASSDRLESNATSCSIYASVTITHDYYYGWGWVTHIVLSPCQSSSPQFSRIGMRIPPKLFTLLLHVAWLITRTILPRSRQLYSVIEVIVNRQRNGLQLTYEFSVCAKMQSLFGKSFSLLVYFISRRLTDWIIVDWWWICGLSRHACRRNFKQHQQVVRYDAITLVHSGKCSSPGAGA